jgi:antitoxin CptB
MSDQDLGRLRWRCRRGMKEIDLLLVAWLEQGYRAASSAQQRAFREFLELPDPEIAGYLLGRRARRLRPAGAQVPAQSGQTGHAVRPQSGGC